MIAAYTNGYNESALICVITEITLLTRGIVLTEYTDFHRMGELNLCLSVKSVRKKAHFMSSGLRHYAFAYEACLKIVE